MLGLTLLEKALLNSLCQQLMICKGGHSHQNIQPVQGSLAARCRIGCLLKGSLIALIIFKNAETFVFLHVKAKRTVRLRRLSDVFCRSLDGGRFVRHRHLGNSIFFALPDEPDHTKDDKQQ